MSDTLCAMPFAHAAHRWDTEDRTILRNSCPGRTSDAEPDAVTATPHIDAMRQALGHTFVPAPDRKASATYVWLDKRTADTCVRVVLSEEDGTEVYVFDVHPLGHLTSVRYSADFRPGTPVTVVMAAVEAAVRDARAVKRH